MAPAEASYTADDGTVVRFEIEPREGWRPVRSPDEVVGQIRAAVGPAIESARVVLDKVREAAPDEVQIEFGIKVSGTANWLVAKAATEGNFKVTLKWRPTGPETVEVEP